MSNPRAISFRCKAAAPRQNKIPFCIHQGGLKSALKSDVPRLQPIIELPARREIVCGGTVHGLPSRSYAPGRKFIVRRRWKDAIEPLQPRQRSHWATLRLGGCYSGAKAPGGAECGLDSAGNRCGPSPGKAPGVLPVGVLRA